MSADLPESTDRIDADAVASIEDDVRDDELSFGDDGADDLGEDSWEPADRPQGVFRHGTTAAEEAEGARLDDRLAAELPDAAALVGTDADPEATDPDVTDPDAFDQGIDEDDRGDVARVARGEQGATQV